MVHLEDSSATVLEIIMLLKKTIIDRSCYSYVAINSRAPNGMYAKTVEFCHKVLKLTQGLNELLHASPAPWDCNAVRTIVFDPSFINLMPENHSSSVGISFEGNSWKPYVFVPDSSLAQKTADAL